MKYIFFISTFLSGLIFYFPCQSQTTIAVETATYEIVLQADKDNMLGTVYCGNKLDAPADYKGIDETSRYPQGNAGIYNNAYTPAGTWNLSEPALQVTHADGNRSLDLKYVSHLNAKTDANMWGLIPMLIMAEPV